MTSPESAIKDPFGASEEEQRQRKIFVATFGMLSKLASADGAISKNEAQIIDSFIKNKLGLDGERKAFAIHVFNKARRDEVSFSDYAAQYAALLQDKPKMLEWMLDIMLRLSCADSRLSSAEQALMREACKFFGISEARYEELRAQYLQEEGSPVDASSAYALLRISETASVEEIIQAYGRLSHEYDPQRIRAFNLPPEFNQLAEQKSAAIKAAYEELKKIRGI